MDTYLIRELERIHYGPGRSHGCRFGVFRSLNGNEEQIGEYERNYGVFYDTFFPFHLNGKDLALYSPDYTVTRIMELPSCADLGGEEPSDMGFCPVEYFVPNYFDQELVHESNNEALDPRHVSVTRVNNPDASAVGERTSAHEYKNLNSGQECTDILTCRPLTPIIYYPFGFVAGCIWGDDSRWKIQFLDLSEADNGVVKREERFGYIMLPPDLKLRDAIDMSGYAYDTNDETARGIDIQIKQTFDLKTGTPIHPFD